MEKTNYFAANRFKGFCFEYDEYRPQPPVEIFDLAHKLQKKRTNLVVDVGCGTGLSTRPWTAYAKKVIGIDPSYEMLQVARKKSFSHPNIVFMEGTGSDTGLEDSIADIVTASSAIHWMKPEPTAKEIGRILKDEGLLVIYGHYYPFYADSYKMTQFHEQWRENLDKLEYKEENQPALKYPFQKTQEFFKASKIFRYVRKHFFHSKLLMSRNKIMGFLEAHAGMPFLSERGYNEDHLMITTYKNLLKEFDKDFQFTVYFTYSVFIAVK